MKNECYHLTNRNKKRAPGDTTVTKVYLYIIVTHKTVYEVAQEYESSDYQKASLQELLSTEYDFMWSALLE